MTHETTTLPISDDRLAKKNTLVLSCAQALYFVGSTIQIALAGLVGSMLADDKSLATLPVTAYVLGTLISTVPASFFMRRWGRKAGFRLGTICGLVSSTFAVYAIFQLNFWMFCLALFFSGGYQAFGQYYRFAAADTASAEFRPTAISWVLAGGLVAAVAGPQFVIYTKEAFAPVMYAGCFVVNAIASIMAFAVLQLLDIPKAPTTAVDGTPPRPLTEILKQKKLKIAIFSGMVSYSSMTFVMTATPLAMVACNHSVDSAALAIQWHVLAMFAPSFFTGRLIARFGREKIILAGLVLLAGAGAIALSGIAIWQFNASLVLLGIGWNLGYIGSTTLVTDCHRPEERNKVQAINEFMVFGLVAFASFASGKLLHESGWSTVAVTYMPLVAVAAGLVLMLSLDQRRSDFPVTNA